MDHKAVELRTKIVAALEDRTLDDRALLAALEALATDFRFPGFSHLWAPVLYARSRARFRPFLLARMNAWGSGGYYDENGRPFDPWKRDDTRAPLEDLLASVERDRDVQLYRRLYEERIGGLWRSSARWRDDLRQRFLAARSDEDRRAVLELLDLPGAELDEPTALAIYDAAPSLSAELLVAHAPRALPWRIEKLGSFPALRERARARGDRDLERRLFRRLATADEWAARVREISTAGTGELSAQLESIHPELTPKNAAEVYRELLERHGERVLPYVTRHLDLRRGFWSSKPIGSDALIALAERKGWLSLWAALIRSSTPDTYDRAVRALVEGRARLGDDETRRRLLLLAGVGRELNLPGLGLAQVMPLGDDTAVALYRAFPELGRTVFRAHVTPTWGRTHAPLTRAAIDSGDEALVDWLASRAVTMMAYPFGAPPKEQTEYADLLSRHYEAIRDPRELARRAGDVLSAVPAHSIWSYHALIRNNRLARLLFERSHEDYLEDPAVVRDLLESPQIHVNALAYRVLAVDAPRARELAARNVDLLSAALLRKLHTRTRALAIDALANATASEEAARAVLPKARDALRLPEKRYPREELIGLIGTILHRHPSLRSERERPIVFGEVRA